LAIIEVINIEIESVLKVEWELNILISRTGLRNKRGKKLEWKFTKKTSKLVREGDKGGIDWWQYQHEIMLPKLIPFYKECLRDRPQTLL
jgi:hypothetical protein